MIQIIFVNPTASLSLSLSDPDHAAHRDPLRRPRVPHAALPRQPGLAAAARADPR